MRLRWIGLPMPSATSVSSLMVWQMSKLVKPLAMITSANCSMWSDSSHRCTSILLAASTVSYCSSGGALVRCPHAVPGVPECPFLSLCPHTAVAGPGDKTAQFATAATAAAQQAAAENNRADR
eukprot:m.167245 g.167245  ORF g.167245 m.167245 type:complete len:123 (-) comp17191_c2_seq1:152-520(-)